MERCCATEECVNKPNAAVFERHREVPARACEGWKLKWTDPGPQVKVRYTGVPGPFEGPKILEAVPYKVVSKCGCCAVKSRRRLRNGIPDPWLEYLDYEAWKESQEDGEDSENQDTRLVKKCIKITNFVWQKKGLALLQGIPDPWKSDLPCECEIKKESKNKKRKSHNKEHSRRRSSTNERKSSSRRSSMNEEETPRRKSLINENESPRRQSTNHEEKSPSRRSTINEGPPRRRSSNKHEETTKRRSKNYDEEPIRRRSKSEEKPKRAMCYAVEPSKTAYVCYGGIVPACFSDYFVAENPSKQRSKHREKKSLKSRSNRYDEETVRRLSKNYDEEVPTKRRNEAYNKEPTKGRSRSYENEIIEDGLKSCNELAECRKKCIQKRHSKSINKNRKKEPTKRLSDTTSDDSSELCVEALKKSRKQSDAAKPNIDKGKTSHSVKKLKTCGSGFDKVKQRLQELENELKAKEAARDLKLREMEQLSKLRKKTCEGKKRSGKVRQKFSKQKSNGWLDDPDELMDKIRSKWKEPVSPRGNYHTKRGECSMPTDRSKTKEAKDLLTTKTSTCCNNKNVSRWLDDPVTYKKTLSKESSKSPKKTEARNVSCRNTKQFQTPQTPIKSICKDRRPVTAGPCSPQATTSPTYSPCPANLRRVSYADEPQPTSRTHSPHTPDHRRVSYSDESQPPTSRTCSPCCRRHQASYVDEPVTPRSNISKSPRCTSISRIPSTASPKESKESLKKFLQEINSRIEITKDALNSPDMVSVAVQPFQEEKTKTWHCPGREFCPRMRERAGGDEGSELFVRRIRVNDVVDREAAELGPIFKFSEKSVEGYDDSDASDRNAGADRAYLQRCSLADFKRRQKEIEELYVESFSERDC